MTIAASLARWREVDINRRQPGVYLLMLDARVVYVGQSVDVETRLAIHMLNRVRPLVGAAMGKRARTQKRGRSGKQKQFDRAFWFPVELEDLNAYEGALIRNFDPILNTNAPSDVGRDDEILALLGLLPDETVRRRFAERKTSRYVAAARAAKERAA